MAESDEPNLEVERLREAQSRVGAWLRGKWRLDALLGVGGIAAVYAGTHRNGLRGAVKVLHVEHSRDRTTIRRFVREGYVANLVAHPSVVRVLDDDVDDDGVPFLVMELLEGEALDERARATGGRLPAHEVMGLTYQLLDVLAAAHDKGIVHRDLKPENLFVLRDGALKVLDFGLAGFFEGRDVGAITGLHGQSTTVMGTPAFMSPEQARGRLHLVDAQSDLWSVGATMFTLLTGEVVHHDSISPAQMLAATFARDARSLADAMPDAPPALVSVVDRALQREKGRRWLDSRSMQDALAEAYRAMFGSPMPPIPAPSPRESFISQRPSSDALFSLTESPSARPRGSSDAPTLVAPPPNRESTPPSRKTHEASPRRSARRHAMARVALGVALGVVCGTLALRLYDARTIARAAGNVSRLAPHRGVASAMRVSVGNDGVLRVMTSTGGASARP